MKEWKLVVAGGLIGMLGMGAGAWVFGSLPVEAQQAQSNYRECFFAQHRSVGVNDQGVVATPSTDRIIRVPAGWTPVSAGSGQFSTGTVMFCRP